MNYPSNQSPYLKWLAWALLLIPILWAAAIAAHIAQDVQGLMGFIEKLPDALSRPPDITWTPDTPRFMLVAAIVYAMGIGVYYSTKRNYRKGVEHGSARWGNVFALCKKYQDPRPADNLLLTQHFRMGLDGHKHRRNLNVLVVGGSGSGKTRFYAKPNVMQANTSFIICDPKGEILRDTGHLLKAKGYEIRVFDLINPAASMGYNPFVYTRDDKDVLKLITNLVRNTTPKSAAPSEPFWEKSEIALLQALMMYLVHEAPPEEQNFSMILDLLAVAGAKEEDEEYQSILDILFERLAMEEPDHIAVKQYQIFKQAAGKTAKSILISAGVRLAAFNLPQISGITRMDEMDISALAQRKTALFCLIPDNDSSFNFIIGLLYTQAFQELYYLADRVHGGRLPLHVHVLMDEFPNVALPDEFDKLLATMRSREISVSIIIQNMAQLKALFKDSHESLIGNCDSFLYLGGNEYGTHKAISEMIGKQTIDTNTYGLTRGFQGHYSTNYQIAGRELLSPDEVRMLDNDHALLFVRGELPVMDAKYDLLRHPNIGLTTDGGHAPYLHDTSPLVQPDIGMDVSRMGDYELLDADAILEEKTKEDSAHA